MNGPLFFAAMMVVVLAFGIAMFWQESRRMHQAAAIYGVEDSIEFIWDGLAVDNLGLKKSDVRRILEWEMHYLQKPELWEPDGEPVVGGHHAAQYAQDKSYEDGHAYEPNQIYAVLDLQAAYLVAIGAVGAPAEPEDQT